MVRLFVLPDLRITSDNHFCKPVRRGNRCFLNMQEQATLFMSSLWLFAVFYSAEDATDLGIAYLCGRWRPNHAQQIAHSEH